jgi:hypothetical protein
MHIPKDIKDDIKAAKKMHLPWWVWLSLIIGCLPIIWLFDRFGKIDLFLPVLNSIGMFGFLIALKWNLRRRAWFWITMVTVAALHVPIILLIPWPTEWVPARAFAGLATVDLLLILAILWVVEKFVEGPRRTVSGN